MSKYFVKRRDRRSHKPYEYRPLSRQDLRDLAAFVDGLEEFAAACRRAAESWASFGNVSRMPDFASLKRPNVTIARG